MIRTVDSIESDTKAFRKKGDKINRCIPIAAHLTDNVALSKSQDLVAAFELQGIVYESYEEAELEAYIDILNQCFTEACDTNMAIYVHQLRRKIDCTYEYEEGDGFLSTFHRDYNEILSSGSTYKNYLYVSFVYRMSDLAKNISKVGVFSRNKKTKNDIYKEVLNDSVKLFNEKLNKFEATVSEYIPIRLGIYDINEVTFSEIGELYNTLLNFNHRPIPLKNEGIDEAISNSQILFRHELGEIRNSYDSRYFSVLGIKDYPSTTFKKMTTPLLSAPFEYNLTTSYKRIDNSKAVEKLDLRQRRMEGAEDRSITLKEQLSIAIDSVASGFMSMGYSNTTLVVFNEDADKLNSAIADADRYLTLSGITVVRENLGLIGQYLSQLPGNFKEQLRNALITSSNFSDLVPMYSHPSGQEDGNHWGKALMPVKTTAETLYHMNIHVEDVGSTNVFGATGSGKTVLMGSMLTHSRKWKPTHVILDKDYGMQLAVEALGGHYKKIKYGQKTGWNPFALPPTDEHKSYLKDLIVNLVGRQVTVREEDEIVDAVNHVYNLDMVGDNAHLRHIDGFMTFLSDHQEDSLPYRLKKWSSDGEYGWVFANEVDDLSFEKGGINAFDLTDVFENEEVRAAVQNYIIYRTKRLIDGSRIMLWIEEGWQYLKMEQTSSFAVDILKTIRKKNGCLVFATQSPDDIALDDKTRPFITESATNIYLPNPKASEEQYKKVFGLPNSAWDFFRGLTKKSRKFIVQNELEFVRCSLDYSGYKEILTVLSATTANVAKVEKMRSDNNGVLPENWIKKLLTGE